MPSSTGHVSVKVFQLETAGEVIVKEYPTNFSKKLVSEFRSFVNELEKKASQVYILLIRGGKNRRTLLAGNVKQMQEIRLNEDLLLTI